MASLTGVEAVRDYAEKNSFNMAAQSEEERMGILDTLNEIVFEELSPGSDVGCVGNTIYNYGRAPNAAPDVVDPPLVALEGIGTIARGKYNGLTIMWAEELQRPEAIGEIVIGHMLLCNAAGPSSTEPDPKLSFCPVTDGAIISLSDDEPMLLMPNATGNEVERILGADYIDFKALDELYRNFVSINPGFWRDLLDYLNNQGLFDDLTSVTTNDLHWKNAPVEHGLRDVTMSIDGNSIFRPGYSEEERDYLLLTQNDTSELFTPLMNIVGMERNFRRRAT